MRNPLRRYYGLGDLHFVTFSGYRRRPLLGAGRARNRFVEILDEVAGAGPFASGVSTATRDLSNLNGLLSGPTTVTLTINQDGTIGSSNSSSSADGVTNSTSGTPGRAFWCPAINFPPFIRVSEP